MQRVRYAIGLHLQHRWIWRELAGGTGNANLGKDKAAAHVDIVITQVHHEVVIDFQLVRVGVVERAKQDVIETELAHLRQDGQFLLQRLPNPVTDRILSQ